MKEYVTAGIYAVLLCVSGTALASTVTVQGTVTQPTCTVTGLDGDTIEVPFGDEVITTRIDGKKYDIQTVRFKAYCDDSMPVGTALQYRISGTPASFDDGLLQTSVAGLGVQFLDNNAASPFPINTGVEKFNFKETDDPGFWVVLARDPSVTLPGGAFTATAMLSLEYQ